MYTLRFPFELPHYQEIKKPIFSALLGNLEIDFKKENRFYVLTIKGFISEDAAEQFIPNIWAGLMWFLMDRGFASIAETEMQKAMLFDDPIKYGGLHGMINDDEPTVYRSDGKFTMSIDTQVSFGLAINAEEVAKYIFKGAAFPNASNGFENKKLRIALELYAAYFTEISPNAKFLTLVMVLESLAESEKNHCLY